MKKIFFVALTLCLTFVATLQVSAQQRSSTTRKSQGRTSVATVANSSGSGGASEETPNESKPTKSEAREGEAKNNSGSFDDRSKNNESAIFALSFIQQRVRQESYAEAKGVSVEKFFGAFMEKTKELDKNGDGIITTPEFATAQPSPPNGEPIRQNGNRAPDGFLNGTNAPPEQPDANREGGRRVPFERIPEGISRPPVSQTGEFSSSRRGFEPSDLRQSLFSRAISNLVDEDSSVNLVKLEQSLKSALSEANVDNDEFLNDDEWRVFAGNFERSPLGRGGDGFGTFPGALRAFPVLAFQNKAQTEALGKNGELDIEKFHSAYLKLFKEADSNNDGVLKEDELRALQQKSMDEMRSQMRRGGENPRDDFGAPPFEQNGGARGNPFDSLKNAQGEIELSRVGDARLPDRLKQDLQSADTNGDGILNATELETFEKNVGERFRDGAPRGLNPPAARDSDSNRRRVEKRPGRNGGDSRLSSNPDAIANNAISRDQRTNSDDETRRDQRPERNPSADKNGGGENFPPQPPRDANVFGRFSPPGGGGNDSVVQIAVMRSVNEEGNVSITDFDRELGKLLSDADNEDDGILDRLEQIDAFGRALTIGDEPEGERRPQDEVNARRRNGADDMMRVRMLPTPDSHLFVAVLANDNFKFSKPFSKGDTAEKAPIANNYALGKYEVRNREYKEFVEATNRSELPKTWIDGSYPQGMKNCPVVGVTVKDAEDYCKWLETKYSGWTFRLPSEAEFENAASGSQKLLYPWDKSSGFSYSKGILTADCQYNARVAADLISKKAKATINDATESVENLFTITNKGVLTKGWRDSKSKTGFTYSEEFSEQCKVGGYVVPVYKFQANRSPYGCIGMSGNAAEWTSTVVDGKNVIRGGSWYSSAEECSATHRGESMDPNRSAPTVGFRVLAEKN